MSQEKKKGFFAGIMDKLRGKKNEDKTENKQETIKTSELSGKEDITQKQETDGAEKDKAVIVSAVPKDNTVPSIPDTPAEIPVEIPAKTEIAVTEIPVKAPGFPKKSLETVEMNIPEKPLETAEIKIPEKPVETVEIKKVEQMKGIESPPKAQKEQASQPSEPESPPPAKDEEKPEKKGGLLGIFKPSQWLTKLRQGLEKTRKSFVFKMTGLFRLRNVIDEDFWEELEDILITADVGLETTEHIVKKMKTAVEERFISEPSKLLEVLRDELKIILGEKSPGLVFNKEGLTVIMVVGVNGTGKTTSIAKIANQLMQENRKVLIAAADTFRAAAIEQLEVWGRKIGLDIIKHKEGADPAAVVFDAVTAAKARNADVLIIDTAGRLHSKVNLMKELEKIKKVVSRNFPDAPHEVLLVLDSTTGQNALIQAKTFSESVDITGIVLTKLDGTAKGGIVIGISHELKIPVKFIGIGEGVYDLRPFEASYFLDALFAEENSEEKEKITA